MRRRKKKRKEQTRYEEIESCNHSFFIEIAGKRVVLLSYFDYTPSRHFDALKALDMFVGLDSAWAGVGFPAMLYKKSLQKYFDMYLEKRQWLNSLVVFPIEDRGIEEVVYEVVAEVFRDGLSLGFGCMGGHGRTGWLAARLIQEFEHCSGDEAVARIRKRFCMRSVESKEQILDLGCEIAKPYKSIYESQLLGKEFGGRWYGF